MFSDFVNASLHESRIAYKNQRILILNLFILRKTFFKRKQLYDASK